jgi:hypothetical protein
VLSPLLDADRRNRLDRLLLPAAVVDEHKGKRNSSVAPTVISPGLKARFISCFSLGV